jgi:hypothetical protein
MTCIVSAYYKIPSKSSHETYIPHLIRWFRSVGTAPNVHFFTTDDVRAELEALTDTGTVVFHSLPFEQLTAMTQWGRAFWERQYARDPERYHSPELAMIWYEKRHFVRRVMETEPSSVYIWCDAGCVRDEDSERAARSFGRREQALADTIHLQQIDNQPTKPFYAYPDTFIAGAILVGTRSAWDRYTQMYDSCLNAYDCAGVSAVSDQYITSSCVMQAPDLFTLHPERTHVNMWFKFLELL